MQCLASLNYKDSDGRFRISPAGVKAYSVVSSSVEACPERGWRLSRPGEVVPVAVSGLWCLKTGKCHHEKHQILQARYVDNKEV